MQDINTTLGAILTHEIEDISENHPIFNCDDLSIQPELVDQRFEQLMSDRGVK